VALAQAVGTKSLFEMLNYPQLGCNYFPARGIHRHKGEQGMPELEIVDLLKEARNMRSLARRIRRLAQTQPDNMDRLKRDADALERQAAVLETRAAEIRQPALF